MFMIKKYLNKHAIFLTFNSQIISFKPYVSYENLRSKKTNNLSIQNILVCFIHKFRGDNL
jgi:hypothetical protein